MNESVLTKWARFVCSRHSKYNTRRLYINPVERVLYHINKPVEEITQKDVDYYVQYCFEEYKQNTLCNKFWTVQKFFKWAGRNDLELPKVSPVDSGKQALDEESTDRLLDTVEKTPALHRLIFYLEFDTIRRPSEIRTLKKNSRYDNILRYEGKTRSITGTQHAVMTERLMKAWDDYLLIRPIPATPEDDQYLILNSQGPYKGTKLHTITVIDKCIKEVCAYAQVKLPEGEQPNSYLIKRTSITRQLKECPDPKIVQLQAGHTDLSTTMKYNRVTDEDVKNYLDVWEDKKGLINGSSRRRRSRKVMLLKNQEELNSGYRIIENEY